MIIREMPLALGANTLKMPSDTKVLTALAAPDGVRLIYSTASGSDHSDDMTFNVLRTGATVAGNFIASVVLSDGTAAHIFEGA